MESEVTNIGKMPRGVDLGFYRELNRTGRASVE